MGATLLILANKQDLHGALPATQIKEVDSTQSFTMYPALSASQEQLSETCQTVRPISITCIEPYLLKGSDWRAT